MTALAPISLMLRHEARLNWRSGADYASHKVKLVILAVLLVFMHLLAAIVPFVLAELPAIPQNAVFAVMSGAGLTLLLLMVSFTLLGTVKLIYSRGDMDLLLSSPIPPYAIVMVRVLAIALGILVVAGVFLLPFANMMAAFHHPRFLLSYVTLVGFALTATAIGMLVAQGMFFLFGPRRTALFAQILAAILGVALVFAANIHHVLPQGAERSFVELMNNAAAWLPNSGSLVWLPARAMLGEPLAVVVMTVICAGFFALTVAGLAKGLMANAIAASGTSANAVKTRSSKRLNPDRGPIAVMRSKEWLLIARDPWLMTQIAKNLIIMVPGMYILWHTTAVPAVWLGLVLLVGQLAGSLAWLTVSTEDSPDLVGTAPVRKIDLAFAKLQAALIPTAVIMAIPLAAAFAFGALIGLTILVCSAGNAVSVSVYHLRHAAPAKRSQIQRRGDDKQMHALYELMIGTIWTVLGVVVLMLGGWWALLATMVCAPVLYLMVR